MNNNQHDHINSCAANGIRKNKSDTTLQEFFVGNQISGGGCQPLYLGTLRGIGGYIQC